MDCRCCDNVKDKENESHSQPVPIILLLKTDVVTMSKIKKMKAIHNHALTVMAKTFDVVTMSKIKKMKAIHNFVVVAEMPDAML